MYSAWAMNAEVLRELGCEHRVFRTVRGAMVWFARYCSGDYDAPVNNVRVVTPREARERARNTHAMLLLALRPTAPDVDGFNLRHIGKLVEWHCSYTPQRELARDWGFPGVRALKQTMRFTETVLAVRLQARGLLE